MIFQGIGSIFYFMYIENKQKVWYTNVSTFIERVCFMFKLARYLKHYKKESIIGPLFKLIEAIFELIVPIVMARIIDIGIKNEDTGYIYKMGAVLILLGFVGLACSLTAQFFAAKASMGFGTELRNALYKHINSLSHAQLDTIGTPTLITRMTNDINQTQTGVNLILRLFLRSPFIVIGAIFMAFSINVKLAVIFLIATPIIALVIYIIMSKSIKLYKLLQKALDKISLITRENLIGVRVIRAFSKQKSEVKRFNDTCEELQSTAVRAGRISAILNPATYVIINLAIIVIIRCGGTSVNNGAITQGEVIALVNYMTQILLALMALSILITNVTKATASAARINDTFAVTTTILDTENTEQTAKDNSAKVQFEKVFMAYNGSDYALEDISFKVFAGQTIGIIGGTGSGKSSLINLIPRFYDACRGKVLIDGIDVRDYPLEQLRSKIGIVLQTATLFTGSIKENIRWGKKDATEEEIWQALDIAVSKEFVSEKPEGLDTVILQGGKNLSGGQRQRLTIARAIVSKPEILILDDSSSALDYATDARLRINLRERTENMTVFIVSQRSMSIKSCDLIIVLDDGMVAGMGTHDSLFKTCDVYREICLSQASAEENKGGASNG